jgi:hypothetical protein
MGARMSPTKIPATCPTCRTTHETMVSAETELKPRAGDYCICSVCSQICEWNDVGELKAIELSDVAPRQFWNVGFAQSFCQHRIKLRGAKC